MRIHRGYYPPNLNLFDEVPPAPLSFSVDEPKTERNAPSMSKDIVKTEVKSIDKPQRNITEIRIFFDDQNVGNILSLRNDF